MATKKKSPEKVEAAPEPPRTNLRCTKPQWEYLYSLLKQTGLGLYAALDKFGLEATDLEQQDTKTASKLIDALKDVLDPPEARAERHRKFREEELALYRGWASDRGLAAIVGETEDEVYHGMKARQVVLHRFKHYDKMMVYMLRDGELKPACEGIWRMKFSRLEKETSARSWIDLERKSPAENTIIPVENFILEFLGAAARPSPTQEN